MTPDEAAIERMAAAIYWAGEHDWLGDPDPVPWEGANSAGKDFARLIARAAFAALIADPPPAIERAVLERLIARADRQEWGGTVRADLWLRRELAELAREERNAPDVI